MGYPHTKRGANYVLGSQSTCLPNPLGLNQVLGLAAAGVLRDANQISLWVDLPCRECAHLNQLVQSDT